MRTSPELPATPEQDVVGLPRPPVLRDVELDPPLRDVQVPELRRTDVYRRPLVDGREVHDGPLRRLRDRIRALLTPRIQLVEAQLEAALQEPVTLSHTAVIAVGSPKGGVGKTTTTFLVGNLLANHLKLRVLAVDANPDFGTLAALAPDSVRAPRSLADLLADLDQVHSAAELRPYVSALPSGLHLLAAPAEAETMARLTPADYAKLLAFCGQWYEVILLDLGTGIAGDFAQFALEQADQVVIVTTPEWVTASSVLGALKHLRRGQATLVLNQARGGKAGDPHAVEAHFARQDLGLEGRVAIPYDERLRTMLDSATYTLGALGASTRVPIKRLGLAVARQLS